MRNENLSISLWTFWKSINFNNCKRCLVLLLVILFFNVNTEANENGLKQSYQYVQNQLSVDKTKIDEYNSDNYRIECYTSSLSIGNHFTPVVGWVYYDGDGIIFIYDLDIWIYISPDQNFCGPKFWFFAFDPICGYTGWFFTSGSDWIFNEHSGWIQWNCDNNYREVNPNQNNSVKNLKLAITAPLTNQFEIEKMSKAKIENLLGFDDNSNDMLNIYPNPITNRANISYSLLGKEQISIDVYDAYGKLQINLLPNKLHNAGKHEIQFDASNLPTGIYYLNITGEKFNVIRKLMVTR